MAATPNQPLLSLRISKANQDLRQCVGVRKAGDEKFFQGDRSSIWYPVLPLFSSLDDLIRSRQHTGRNCQPDLLGGFEINYELELRRLLDW